MTFVYNLLWYREFVALVPPSERKATIRDLKIVDEIRQIKGDAEAIEKRGRQLVAAAIKAAR